MEHQKTNEKQPQQCFAKCFQEASQLISKTWLNQSNISGSLMYCLYLASSLLNLSPSLKTMTNKSTSSRSARSHTNSSISLKLELKPGVSTTVTPGLPSFPSHAPLEYVLCNVPASTPCPTGKGPERSEFRLHPRKEFPREDFPEPWPPRITIFLLKTQPRYQNKCFLLNQVLITRHKPLFKQI